MEAFLTKHMTAILIVLTIGLIGLFVTLIGKSIYKLVKERKAKKNGRDS